MKNKMKAVYTDTSLKGRLVYGDVAMPKLKAAQVLVEIQASSMNPHDWKYYQFMKKFYNTFLPLPKFLFGHDVSGVVQAVGSAVKKFKVGDELYSMTLKPGAFCEYASIDESMVALKPKNLTHTEAATIPMAALTALQAFEMAKIKRGSTVLIIGASGGVGSMAVQIAKAKGARVVAVCSGKNKAMVESLGADEVIDYTKEEFLSSGKKFNIIFDTIGHESINSCKNIILKQGCFISISLSAHTFFDIAKTKFTKILDKEHVNVITLLAMPKGKDLKVIADLIEAGKIIPVVDKTFNLDRLEDAIEYSKQGRTRGKIAIKVKAY